MASLSPVTAMRPVGEARLVRTILLPVRMPTLRRVFRDSDHAECSLVVEEQIAGLVWFLLLLAVEAEKILSVV